MLNRPSHRGRTPHYALSAIQRLVQEERYRITVAARRGASALYLDESESASMIKPHVECPREERCPVCDAAMTPVAEEREVSVGRRSALVLDHFVRCSGCGEEVYLPGQMEQVQRRAARAIRTREGLLQPEEIRALRERLELSQAGFEALLGVGPKTVVRWERGTVFQNAATDALLRVIDRFPGVVGFLAELHGLEHPARGEQAGT